MSYHEIKSGDLVTILLTCDARKKKTVCGNMAEATTLSKKSSGKFLFDLGWRLLRGKQVCPDCLRRGVKNVHFPREVKA